MKSDEIAIEDISEVKIVSLSSSKGQVINTASEGQASGSSNSSDSSPSDLRRRLQDLPSPDEFGLVADRATAFGRRVCKRELFSRLQGVAGRIEEKDESEDKESTGSWSSFTKPKDARARRRARARLESSSDRDDKAMLITRVGKSSLSESSVDRPRIDNRYSRLPAIEMSRRQHRPVSVSEPCSTRLPRQKIDDGPGEIRANARTHGRKNYAVRDHAPRSVDLPSVSPFPVSKVRPRQFGGYRPSTGVVVTNLSSESESESTANETNRGSARNVGDSTPEVTSPKSKVVNGPVKKMPIMSARSDITESILPNLLPSARSYRDDDLDRASFQGTGSRTAERTSDQAGKALQSIFSARSFTDSDEPVASICDEKAQIQIKVRRAISELEDKLRAYDKIERRESHYIFAAQVQRNDNQDQRDLDPPVNRSDPEVDRAANIRDDVRDERNQPKDIYAEEVENTPRLFGGKNEENALSSRDASEASESEDHPREGTSSRESKNGADSSGERDREIGRAINVPALALDSRDISYSTATDSRECSVTRPLGPRALIEALSTVSLTREGASRKLEDDFRCSGATDAPDSLAKRETWRVPRSSRAESSDKSLPRVPSRIPVRIPSGKLSLAGSASKSGFREQPENASDEETGFGLESDRSGIRREPEKRIARRSEVELLYSRARERDFSLESNVNADKAGDEEYEANDYEPRGLTFSDRQNPRSAPCGDCAYDGTQRSLESGTRKRTANVTSVESPCLSRYKKNESYCAKSPRNIEKSFTWRTEDECASIQDEENLEDAGNEIHCGSYKSGGLRSPARDRFHVAIEETYDSRQSEVEKLAKRPQIGDDVELSENGRDRGPELTKIAQSGNVAYQVHKTQEICSLIARISSSSNHEQKRRKKSQERFPFTISEAGILSAGQKDTCDYRESLDKNCTGKADVQLDVKTVHQLATHPSITRLAISGREETMGEILSCAARQEKEKSPTRSKMRALMRVFSSKAKKTKRSNRSESLEATEVIYKNRACQAGSGANSCSGDSHRTSSTNDELDNNHLIDYNVTRYHVTQSNPTLAPSGNAPTESLEEITQEHPHRRYDRDDRWVRDIKDPPLDEGKINETLRENAEDNSQESPSRDRYSIFLAQNLESDKLSKNSPREQHDVTSSRVLLPDKKRKQAPSNFVSGKEDEDVTGCFCLKLCHLFASSSRDRSSVKEQIPLTSRAEKSASLLQEKQK